MYVSKPTPTEAEDLLTQLRSDISEVASNSTRVSAVHFVGHTMAADLAEQTRCLAAARTAAASFGSLPVSPPTIRAHLGLLLVRLVNRMLWWQTVLFRRFAAAMCECAHAQMEEQATQRQISIEVEERLRAIERTLEQLRTTQRRPDVEERPE